MASETPNGIEVAILATDSFEQVEMAEPRMALDAAGATTELVFRKDGEVKAWKFTEWGDTFPVGVPLDDARPEDFDATLLSGGVLDPDTLRTLPAAVAFAEGFFDAGKPVAAICHDPWTVIEAGAARGRRLTSWPSLKTSLGKAGAEGMDQEVVVDDRGLVTSRQPDDVPAFDAELIELFASARRQARQGAAR